MNEYKLYQGDCLEILPTIPDESIDLIITDPPYGIDKEGVLNDHSLEVYYNSLKDCYRVLKPDSFYITFNSIGRLPEFFHNNPFTYRWQFIVYTNNGMVRGGVGFSRFMSALIFQKGDAKFKKQLLDVQEVSTSSQECAKRVHPTEKRVDSIEKILTSFSKEDDVVLDPFLGGGTTMFACQNMRRGCIGMELHPSYIETIKKRCFTRRFLDREVKYEFYNSSHTTVKTPANDIEEARKHHAKHGDMDGHTCLLNECALHYPKEEKQ